MTRLTIAVSMMGTDRQVEIDVDDAWGGRYMSSFSLHFDGYVYPFQLKGITSTTVAEFTKRVHSRYPDEKFVRDDGTTTASEWLRAIARGVRDILITVNNIFKVHGMAMLIYAIQHRNEWELAGGLDEHVYANWVNVKACHFIVHSDFFGTDTRMDDVLFT